MKEFIEQFGSYSPLIFLLLASILPIFLFPPGIFSIVGGYLFGFSKGIALTIAAAIIYTNIMFLISRYFAKDKIEIFLKTKLSKKQYNKVFSIPEKKLAIFLVIFRLIPILPNAVVSYSYGLTKITFKNYFIANILGLIPGRLLWIKFGSSLNNIWSTEFFVSSILLVVVFLIIGWFFTKKWDND